MEWFGSDCDILSAVFQEKLTSLLRCALQNQHVRVLAAERQERGGRPQEGTVLKPGEGTMRRADPVRAAGTGGVCTLGKEVLEDGKVFEDLKVLRPILSNSLSYWEHYYWEESLERMPEWAEIIKHFYSSGCRSEMLARNEAGQTFHLVSSLLSGSGRRKDVHLRRQSMPSRVCSGSCCSRRLQLMLRSSWVIPARCPWPW